MKNSFLFFSFLSMTRHAAAFFKCYENPVVNKNSYVKQHGVLVNDVITGFGPCILEGDEIEVHYTGYYYAPGAVNGIKFDDSTTQKKGFILKYGTSPLILGWNLGLENMRQGGIRTIIIPPNLAYGSEVVSRGTSTIPANSELLFDLELVKVKKKKQRTCRLRNFLN